MTESANKPTDQTRNEIKEILDRVDHLPTLDNRPQDEIVGFDGKGVPSYSVTGGVRPVIPNAVEDFIKYRHREWEENLGTSEPNTSGPLTSARPN